MLNLSPALLSDNAAFVNCALELQTFVSGAAMPARHGMAAVTVGHLLFLKKASFWHCKLFLVL